MVPIPWRALLACMCLSGALLAAADFALGGHRVVPGDYLAVAALGASIGALCALCWSGLFWLGRLPSWRWLVVCWSAFGLYLGSSLARQLGAFSRLGGRHAQLALGVLAAALVAGIGVALLGLAHQPRPERPRGLIGSRSARLRGAWALALSVSVGVCLELDRSVDADNYVPVHVALHLLALWLLGFAVLALWPASSTFERRRWVKYGPVVGLLIVVAGLSGLNEAEGPRLHRVLQRPQAGLHLELLRKLVDVDHDGYAGLLGGGDCEPFNPQVHPGKRERPNNGRDDNCRFGDLVENEEPPVLPPVPATAAPMSVVLITIDALSAEHLGSYGYARATSPALDVWAKQALRFDHAYTTGGWTTLALTSMFRGLYPRKLEWTRLTETTRYRLLRRPIEGKLQDGEKARKEYMMPLDDPNPTLPELLKRRGVFTAAVVDDSYTYVLASEVGGFTHFDKYVEIDTDASGDRRASDADTTRQAIAMLRKLAGKKQFFLWVHYFGVHAPSERHRGVPTFGTDTVAGYDHEIAHLDRSLVPLLKKLDATAKKTSLAVFVTADHGEHFSSSGRSHGLNLNEDGIRIPLFVKAPGVAAGVRREVASLIDLMPTVLALTGTPAPARLDGINILGPGPKPKRVLLTDTWRIDDAGGFNRDLVAAFDGTRKLTVDRLNHDQHLSRQDDPEERDLFDSEDAPALRRALDAYLESNGALVLRN